MRRGYELLSAYAVDAGIPVERTGALLVAWDEEQAAALPALQAKAVTNGYDAHAARRRRRGVRRRAAPRAGRAGRPHGARRVDHLHVDGHAGAGHRRREPRSRAAARARGARGRGRRRSRPWCTPRAASSRRAGSSTRQGWAATSSTAWSATTRFTITPRKGQLIVYDKLARHLVNSIVLPVPTALGKGVLVSPTVYGNVMVGPTAEDIDDRTDTATTAEGFAFLTGKAATLVPALRARGGHRHVRRSARGERALRLRRRRRRGAALRRSPAASARPA